MKRYRIKFQCLYQNHKSGTISGFILTDRKKSTQQAIFDAPTYILVNLPKDQIVTIIVSNLSNTATGMMYFGKIESIEAFS